jgi:hypothetical protein
MILKNSEKKQVSFEAYVVNNHKCKIILTNIGMECIYKMISE